MFCDILGHGKTTKEADGCAREAKFSHVKASYKTPAELPKYHPNILKWSKAYILIDTRALIFNYCSSRSSKVGLEANKAYHQQV